MIDKAVVNSGYAVIEAVDGAEVEDRVRLWSTEPDPARAQARRGRANADAVRANADAVPTLPTLGEPWVGASARWALPRARRS
jgi:hypothetical protein